MYYKLLIKSSEGDIIPNHFMTYNAYKVSRRMCLPLYFAVNLFIGLWNKYLSRLLCSTKKNTQFNK